MQSKASFFPVGAVDRDQRPLFFQLELSIAIKGLFFSSWGCRSRSMASFFSVGPVGCDRKPLLMSVGPVLCNQRLLLSPVGAFVRNQKALSSPVGPFDRNQKALSSPVGPIDRKQRALLSPAGAVDCDRRLSAIPKRRAEDRSRREISFFWGCHCIFSAAGRAHSSFFANFATVVGSFRPHGNRIYVTIQR